MFILGVVIASLPFIVPLRDFPDGDFYSNATALFLACLLIALRLRRFGLNSSVVCIALLGLLILTSGKWSNSYYYESWMLPGFALLLLAAIISGTSTLPPSERLAFFEGTVLGLLLGGAFSVLIAYFQYSGISHLLYPVAFRSDTGIYANMGQRNLFTTYILCSCLAGCYLHAKRKISNSIFWPFMASVSFILAAAESRMVLLDALSVSLLLLASARLNQGNKPVSQLLSSTTKAILLIVAFQLGFLILDKGGAHRITIAGDTHRLGEWIKSLHMFLDNPLGVGYGNYAKVSFNYRLDGYSPESSLTWTHSHNLLLQLLVELGVWVVPLIIMGVWLYFKTAAHCLASAKGLMLLMCINFILIHSLLEYPLWHMDFLVLLVVLIAHTSSRIKGRELTSLRLFAALALIAIITTTTIYSRIPAYQQADVQTSVNLQRLSELTTFSATPVLGWSADKVLMTYLPFDDAPDSIYTLCKAISLATREPLYPYLERVALISLARQDFTLASSVLKSRYTAYPQAPDTYLKANIRHRWPKLSDDYEEKIRSLRATDFKDIPFFRLELPSTCN